MTKPSIEDLITNLRFRSTWIAICEGYLRQCSDPNFQELLQDLLDTEREAVEMLAAALRQHDVSPMQVHIDERLLGQALSRRNNDARLNFIRQGLETSQAWYQTQLSQTPDSDSSLWRELKKHQAEFSSRCAQQLGIPASHD